MRRFEWVFGSVLVVLAFSAWCYCVFFRVTKTYHLDVLRTRAIDYGTPEGKVHIRIPPSVASREDFIRFCEPFLRDHDPWRRAVASVYLARSIKKGDPLYRSLQKRIWDLCETTVSTDQSRLLTGAFWFVAEEEYTDRIMSRLDSEPDRHVRASLLHCLGRIRSEKSTAFLEDVALASSDPDDAYAAARNVSSGSSRQEIQTVEKYLGRRDAKNGIIAGPSMPTRLQSMKMRLSYRRGSLLIAVLFPVLVCLAHVRWRTKHAQPVRMGKLAIAEAALLLGYCGSVVSYVLTALGGGDTGAFSPAYRATMNHVFICFLLGLYVINVISCQKYVACLQAARRKSAERYAAKANLMFGIFFLNLALILRYLSRMVSYV